MIKNTIQTDSLRYIAMILENQCGEAMRNADSDYEAEEIASEYYDRLLAEMAAPV